MKKLILTSILLLFLGCYAEHRYNRPQIKRIIYFESPCELNNELKYCDKFKYAGEIMNVRNDGYGLIFTCYKDKKIKQYYADFYESCFYIDGRNSEFHDKELYIAEGNFFIHYLVVKDKIPRDCVCEFLNECY